MLDVLTISGSPGSISRAAAVLDYSRSWLQQRGLRCQNINVRDLPPEDLVYARANSPEILASAALLRQARAVIIATPVYKASYSGLLKTYLDLMPERALLGKLVLPIAIGGSSLHMLAIDYALRPVLTALGAQHTLQGVYIVDSQIQFSDGALQLDPAIIERIDAALQYIVDQLIGLDAIVQI